MISRRKILTILGAAAVAPVLPIAAVEETAIAPTIATRLSQDSVAAAFFQDGDLLYNGVIIREPQAWVNWARSALLRRAFENGGVGQE